MSSRGTVYKLCCVDTDITEEYVGSTKNFNRRKASHKSSCNNEKSKDYNLNVYEFIRANGSWNNWRMIQLESVNYETRRDLEAHERRWIEQLKPELNKQIPTRTHREYRENNKDKMHKYQKEYHKINKDTVNEKHRGYYKQNKDKKKEYYEQNKDKINKKIRCIYCDIDLKNRSLQYHNNTQKHIYNYIYY